MELNLKNLLAKISGKPTQEQQTLLEKQAQERIAKQLEIQAQNADKAAKLNILDAELSIRNIDTLLQSGKLGDNEEKIAEAEMLKSIADEQRTYNLDFLLQTSQIEASKKIDKFSKNSAFASASQSLNYGYDNVLGLGENGRGYRVYPNVNVVLGVDADSVIIKFQNMIKGMSKKQAVNVISEMVDTQSSAVEFVSMLQKEQIITIGKINEKSKGYEARMFAFAMECAENVYQKRMAEKQKEQIEQAKQEEIDKKMQKEMNQTPTKDKGLEL
jgi:flagellar basal body rod protein FlgC